MNFRIINILIAFLFFITPCVVFGLTGKTPEEDDCANKYNEFRKCRDELQNMSGNRNVGWDCEIIGCADRGIFLTGLKYISTPFLTFCDNIGRLMPFAGTGVPFPQTQVGKEILKEFQDAVAAGASDATDILDAIMASSSLSEAAVNALKEILPTDWAALAAAIQEQINGDLFLKCLDEERTKAREQLAEWKKHWKAAMENYEDAKSAIKDGDTACDADFSHTSPSKPDYDCANAPEPVKGDCFACGMRERGF